MVIKIIIFIYLIFLTIRVGKKHIFSKEKFKEIDYWYIKSNKMELKQRQFHSIIYLGCNYLLFYFILYM